MIVDTSALIAILLNEPDAIVFAGALAAAPKRMISAVSALETAIVIQRKKGSEGVALLDDLFAAVQLEIVSMDEAQYRLAREAYQRFGKGMHSAGLNFGDCCSYALARQQDLPLLFKGDDFARTDIHAAQLPIGH